jgi:hypothetical protein
MLQAEKSQVQIPIRSLDFFFFSIYLILPAALGPGVDSAFNRNEYQESSWGTKGGPAREADPQRHLRDDCLENDGVLTSQHPIGPHGLLQE